MLEYLDTRLWDKITGQALHTGFSVVPVCAVAVWWKPLIMVDHVGLALPAVSLQGSGPGGVGDEGNK